MLHNEHRCIGKLHALLEWGRFWTSNYSRTVAALLIESKLCDIVTLVRYLVRWPLYVRREVYKSALVKVRRPSFRNSALVYVHTAAVTACGATLARRHIFDRSTRMRKTILAPVVRRLAIVPSFPAQTPHAELNEQMPFFRYTMPVQQAHDGLPGGTGFVPRHQSRSRLQRQLGEDWVQ